MKLKQLEYIIETHRLGSISKASEKLFVSQPNISNAIKSIETEYGFRIFKRTNRGVSTTHQGRIFIAKAQNILKQCHDIAYIANTHESMSLTVAGPSYSPIIESFVRFTQQQKDIDRYDYALKQTYGNEILDFVYNSQADLGIFLTNELNLQSLSAVFEQYALAFHPLGELRLYVKLRHGHPILEHNQSIFEHLKHYPYVHFNDHYYFGKSYTQKQERLSFIDYSKEIQLFDRDAKNKIITTTDAYTIGLKLNSQYKKDYNWNLIPIPDVTATIGYIYPKDKPLTYPAQLYLKLLDEELSELVI